MMESKLTAEQSVALVKARISKRKSLHPEIVRAARIRAFSPADPSSPTKDLDAVVLANTLIGYGENISLENSAIIENIIKFAKLEASYEVPDNNPRAWYEEFLTCMDLIGCSIPDSGFTEYEKSTQNLTMDNVIVDIVKTGIAAAKAAIPGATVLSAITESTLGALKEEPEAIELFNREVTKDKGVRLTLMPCDQLANGMIITTLASIDSDGVATETSPVFSTGKPPVAKFSAAMLSSPSTRSSMHSTKNSLRNISANTSTLH